MPIIQRKSANDKPDKPEDRQSELKPRRAARLGGLAVAKKIAPPYCPKCGREFAWATPWMSYLGHLGLHGLADNYFGGDIEATQRRLRNNGLARQDPMPYNNAWPKYKPVMDS